MLTLDQIKAITAGALRIWEENGMFCFSRFTPAQEELLRQRDFHPKEGATSAMRLEFTTRGGTLSFDYQVDPGCERDYYGIEITVDGLGMYHLYKQTLPDAGQVCYTVPASEKPVKVAVYFPNLACLRIGNVCLPEDHAPCRRSRKYLALGDSITQGYDATHPNQCYVNLLADALDAEVLDQAIGGDVFFAGNLDPQLPFAPDFITVAYGTNDWNRSVLISDAVGEYVDTLAKIYPHKPIFLLLPIWRAIETELRQGVTLAQGREFIAKAAQGHPNVHVVDCTRFVPFLPEYFYDGVLHPNDLGFLYYAKALEQAIRPHIV